MGKSIAFVAVVVILSFILGIPLLLLAAVAGAAIGGAKAQKAFGRAPYRRKLGR
jgi:hypothetical protein